MPGFNTTPTAPIASVAGLIARSFQSRMRENASAPTTNGILWIPERMNIRDRQGIDESAADRLNIKGHRAGIPCHRTAADQAVLGKI